MSELLEQIKALRAEIQAQREEIHKLTLLVIKDKVDTTWLTEADAAQTLGIAAKTLRQNVKAGRLDITSRNTNGRNWQYSRKSIMSYKNLTSYN